MPPEDNTIQALLDEQTAHAATQAALATTEAENKGLRAGADHRQQLINEAHGALDTAGAPPGYPAQRIAHLLAERDHWKRAAVGAEEVSAATEAENRRLRAELAALQARVARTIANAIPASPDLPPRAEGDVRDGVMSGAEADATERAEVAERKLARARRIVHRLVDLHIDDTTR